MTNGKKPGRKKKADPDSELAGGKAKRKKKAAGPDADQAEPAKENVIPDGLSPELSQQLLKTIGNKVRIVGDHPHSGEHGEIIAWKILAGLNRLCPEVLLESGDGCFVVKGKDLQFVDTPFYKGQFHIEVPPNNNGKDKNGKRSAIQIDLDDDKILDLHFQHKSLRRIALEINVSHETVKVRLKKILDKIKSTQDETQAIKVKFAIQSQITLKRKAWDLLESESEFKFKYLEIIHKADQEINKLQGLYPKEQPKPPEKPFADAIKELDATRAGYKEPENSEDDLEDDE